MSERARKAAEQALGVDVRTVRALSGGCVGEVYRAELADGRTVVVKADAGSEPRLDVEGFMLSYLHAHSRLPVPQVYHSTPRLLIMEFVEGDSRFSAKAQDHAAELLADLHGVRQEQFGLERDTLIGGLHQPNPLAGAWIPFFREHRVVYMAEEAARAGQMDRQMLVRVQRFAEKLEDLLEEPEYPSLLHGDVWTTNVLAAGSRITAFLDPAVYAGHPEIELAFITLFGTFGDAFFARYDSLRPIRPGFFEQRRDIYNIYPLLVHVRLFGGGYVSGVDQVLRRHQC